MAVTWKVVSYDGTKTVGSLSDVLTTLHWTATDTETVSGVEHSGSHYGSVELSEPDSSSFIALASITTDNLITWLKAALGSDKVTEYETSIAGQITKSKEPVTFSGVPS
jgi:hypothetical protein